MAVDWTKTITLTGSALGAAGLAWKLILKSIYARAHFALTHRRVKRIQRENALDDMIQTVKRELSRNGGGSMKDLVVSTATGLKALEERVATMQERQKVSLMDTPEGRFTAAPNGHMVEVNRTFERLTGRPERDVLGWGWVDIVHPEDQNDILHAWREALKQERNFDRDFRILVPDRESGANTVVNVHAVARPVRGMAGIVEWLGIFVRKRDQRATDSTV